MGDLLKKLIFVVFLNLVIVNFAHANPIRYNIVNGYDILGDKFTGFVDIEENLVGDTAPCEDFHYDILNFMLKASGNSFIGTNGSFQFSVDPLGLVDTGNAIALLTSDNGIVWSAWGGESGVWFDGALHGSSQSYLALPQDINFYLHCPLDATWGPIWGNNQFFTIERAAPVPEPATIILLGTGLLGLYRFRMKLK